jgi:hypothetical protein
MIVDQLVEWRFAGETEVLGENLPQLLCPPQIPHDQTQARTPGRRGGKPATNRLSYGAAVSGQFYALTTLPPKKDPPVKLTLCLTN